MLIEDAASGQQLIQTLWADEPAGVPSPIPRRPKGDKISRVMGVSSIDPAGVYSCLGRHTGSVNSRQSWSGSRAQRTTIRSMR
jgi:hypothetical protein